MQVVIISERETPVREGNGRVLLHLQQLQPESESFGEIWRHVCRFDNYTRWLN